MYSRAISVANADNMLKRLYWTTVHVTLLIGFAINFYMVKTIPAAQITAINPWLLFGGYIVACITGIAMSKMSDNPVISFLGFLLVVVPVGVIITPFLQDGDPMIIQKAALYTAILTGIMAMLAFTFPSFFKGLGSILFWALIAAIIAEFALMFMGYDLKMMDWIVAVVFLGFLGYDYSKALEDDATIDAGIDRAVSLYLDIINLFLRTYSILSGGSSSK